MGNKTDKYQPDRIRNENVIQNQFKNLNFTLYFYIFKLFLQ